MTTPYDPIPPAVRAAWDALRAACEVEGLRLAGLLHAPAGYLAEGEVVEVGPHAMLTRYWPHCGRTDTGGIAIVARVSSAGPDCPHGVAGPSCPACASDGAYVPDSDHDDYREAHRADPEPGWVADLRQDRIAERAPSPLVRCLGTLLNEAGVGRREDDAREALADELRHRHRHRHDFDAAGAWFDDVRDGDGNDW